MKALKNSIDTKAYAMELAKSNKNKYTLPDYDCPLLQKHGIEYLEHVEKEDVVLATKAYIGAVKVDFCKLNINEKAVAAALAIEAMKKGLMYQFSSFKTVFGFDFDCLPDQIYMLKLLCSINRHSDLIELLPEKKEQEMSTVQMSALMKTLTMGKELKTINGVEVPKEISKPLVETATGYLMIRFKLKETKDQLSGILKLTDTNPFLRVLCEENKQAIDSVINQVAIGNLPNNA